MSGPKPSRVLHNNPTKVVAADPAQPFTPRPVISELLRTRHCVQGSILLVEGIEAQVPVSKRYRTVRLLLGDGDLCIQALLRTEMHRFVDHGSIYVGGYVQLTKFELQVVPTKPEDAPDDVPPVVFAETGEVTAEDIVFLVVWDMVTVGWNTAYMQMAGVTHAQEDEEEEEEEERGEQPPLLQGGRPEADDAGEVEKRRPQCQENEGNINMMPIIPPVLRAATQPAKPQILRVGEKKSDSTLPETNNNDTIQQGKGHFHPQRANTTTTTMTTMTTTTTRKMTTTNPGISYSAGTTSSNLPWTSDDLSQPLKLTPLKSIPNLPYKQNWVVNVLAVVASLSEIEAATLPPFKQRTARLADPSTSKQVLLTVFLDPDAFTPRVGSVVLLLGVKNHRFDGGCLKKYGNEKPKPGGKWWFENPRDIEWCDVEVLRAWWVEKSRKIE